MLTNYAYAYTIRNRSVISPDRHSAHTTWSSSLESPASHMPIIGLSMEKSKWMHQACLWTWPFATAMLSNTNPTTDQENGIKANICRDLLRTKLSVDSWISEAPQSLDIEAFELINSI